MQATAEALLLLSNEKALASSRQVVTLGFREPVVRMFPLDAGRASLRRELTRLGVTKPMRFDPGANAGHPYHGVAYTDAHRGRLSGGDQGWFSVNQRWLNLSRRAENMSDGCRVP